MDIKQIITGTLNTSIRIKQNLVKDEVFLESMEILVAKLIDMYSSGKGCLFLAGNGGSAADAQHIAAELVGRFILDRQGLNAEALTVDTSILTSVGNDFGFDDIYRRQLEGKARPGDVFIGISTSGNSPNIIKALEFCRTAGIYSVGLTGKDGGIIKEICDLHINVPHNMTPRVQEAHITIGHILCDLVEQGLAE